MNKQKGLPAYQPMSAYRGDTFTFSLRIVGKNPATGESYLLDTTGFTARYQVRETVDSTTVLTAAPITVGISGTGDTATNLTVRIPDTVTATYPHGANWRYDLELTDPSGRRKTLMFGEFTVMGDVAK